MDDQSACWRCGEPKEAGAVCDLCGAVPARQRMRVRAGASSAPEASGGGAAVLATLAPPRPVNLAPPRPSDRVSGPAAPPAPTLERRPRRPRSLWWVKITASVVVSLAGFSARLLVRDFVSRGPDRVQQATSASDFSGRCVMRAGTRVETVSCREPHTGRVTAVVSVSAHCPASAVDSVVVRSDPTKRLCITPA